MNVKEIEGSLIDCARRAVEHAVGLGADQAEAGASHDEGQSVTVRMGELESVERLLCFEDGTHIAGFGILERPVRTF